MYSATPMARARRACPDGVFLAPRFDALPRRQHRRSWRSCSRTRRSSSRSRSTRRSSTSTGVAPPARHRARDRGGDPRPGEGRDRAHRVGRRRHHQAAGQAGQRPRQARRPPRGRAGHRARRSCTRSAVRRLWGVGPATERQLTALGVEHRRRARGPPRGHARATRSATPPGTTSTRSRGTATSAPVVADQEVKSIGHEETFPVDLHDHAALDHRLVGLADGVASRLRAAAVTARTVQLKVRFGDFTTITRSRTLRRAHRPRRRPRAGSAGELLHALDVGAGVRLLGVSGQQLVRRAPSRPPTRATLFGEPGTSRAGAGTSPPVPTPADEAGAARSGRRPPGGARAVGRRGPGPVRSWCRGARYGRVACQGKVRGARRVEDTEAVRENGSAPRRVARSGSPGTEMGEMPLSEDEQRILREIEENLSATDPKLVQQVSDTHALPALRPRHQVGRRRVHRRAAPHGVHLHHHADPRRGRLPRDARLRARHRAQRAQARARRGWRASPARCATAR